MRKSLSLMLSAALTLGSVATSYAAPLAKKAGGLSPESKVAAKAMQAGADKGKLTIANPKLIKTATSKVAGLREVKSQLQAKKKTALRSATAAQRAVAANINLRGEVIYADSWEEANYGMYTVPAAPSASFDLVAPLEAGYIYGSVDNGDGRYYGVNYQSFMGIIDIISVDVYDTDSWELLDTKDASYDVMSLGAALDPTTGDIYGVFYAVEGEALVKKWAKADYENVTSIPIADFSLDVISVGADNNGQFYAVGQDMILYKIDKATGETEAVGPVELPAQYAAGGCVNTSNNTYLQAYCTDDASGLVEIDLATGESTNLYEFSDGEQVVGLYIAKPAAEDKAPAAPQLEVTCENGAMAVQVKLTMPTTLFDGTPAAGQTFSYSVLADGEEIMTGSALAGAEVSETVDISTSGVVSFAATASNATGASPKAKASCYVGKGTPAAPQNVNLTWASNTATLTWDAVTTASDGGYINPADVTYTVLDSEGQMLAEGITATTYTKEEKINPAQFRDFCFSVKAVYDGKSSEAVTSNRVGLGNRRPPFAFDMTDPVQFGYHYVLDANDDGKTWKYGSGVTLYSYSGTNNADDWLFSPPLLGYKGHAYKITAHVCGSSYFPERIEILAGTGQTAEKMTATVVPATVLDTSDEIVLEGWFTPSAAGFFFIGFHAISDADMNQLKLISYEISAPVAGTAPDAVEELSVKRNLADAFKADISFKAPSKAVDGSALTGNVKVKVLCGDRLVAEPSLAPGESTSLQDAVSTTATYTYTIIPVNADGQEGKSKSASALIGASQPAAPTGAVGVLSGNTLKVSWDPVNVDVDGEPISADHVTYNVWTVEGRYLGEVINETPLTATNFSFDIEVPETQDFVQYAVQAINYDVEGPANGFLVTVGPAYDMPVIYSGEASLETYILGTSGDGSAGLGDSSLGVDPFDGDDYFYIKHAGLGGTMTFMTGKIAVTGESPVVIFREFKVADADINETVVSVLCDGETTELATFSNADNEAGVWNKCKVSLAQFKGKDVQVFLTGVCKSHAYSIYDEISIMDDVNYDLSAKIAAPKTVDTGTEFDVVVTVSNDGAEDADAYSVNLYRNGEIVDTKASQYGLAEGEKENITFQQTLGLHDGESAEYKAVVVYEADENPDNNETETVTVARKLSNLPKVTGLAGERSEQGVSLTWDEIVIGDAMPTLVEEGFEEGVSGAQEFEGWTFLDNDDVMSGGIQDVEIPGFTGGESKCSFLVFEPGASASAGYQPHSGTKCLISLYAIDPAQNDDWAISPVLSGDAQTITFWAASCGQYLETFEMYYTTMDSTDPADFVKVGEHANIPSEWKQYSFEVPEGAKHFAIRNVSADKFMLRLDDFTFTKLDGFDGELKGYNVYRDGVKINDALVAEPSFVDTEADAEAHTYHVTAVYDKGESELSEPVTIDQSGVDAVLAAGMKVAVEGKFIVVTGAAGKLVTINAVDGKTIHSAQGDARVAVNSAIYLVTVDRKTVKVIVR